MRKLRARAGRPLGAPVLIPVSEAAKALPEKMQEFPVVELGGPIPGKNRKVRVWSIKRPLAPELEVWAQLTKARTVSQIRKAARRIGELEAEFGSSTDWMKNPAGALSHYAEGILVAKELPHYPRTDRKRSDDKRVVFLAKVMAGLTLGLAPITAIKRLSHWSWPRDWAETALKDNAERLKGSIYEAM